ncbi:MAG TPA: hypothetical protein VJS67_12480 [Pseudonocardiaceae bacterium]|nr:hypothetical protein [Pseudonocardiaceae bacterium]
MWSVAGWWIALSGAAVLGVSPLDRPSEVDDNPACVVSVCGTVLVLAVAGCGVRSDPALCVDADVGCRLVEDPAGALVAVPVPVVGTVLDAGWLAGMAGAAAVLVAAECPAAVLDAIGAALDVPDDCGGTCPVSG